MGGQSGQNGKLGLHGSNGKDARAGKPAVNFTVRINVVDENKEKRTQRIAITVEGPDGTIIHPNDNKSSTNLIPYPYAFTSTLP